MPPSSHRGPPHPLAPMRWVVLAALGFVLAACGGGAGDAAAPTPAAPTAGIASTSGTASLQGPSTTGSSPGTITGTAPVASIGLLPRPETSGGPQPAGPDDPPPNPNPDPGPGPDRPASRAEAARFLTQATFGPTEADVQRLMAIGYSAWIDEQMKMPLRPRRALWEAADARIKAADAAKSAGANEFLDAWWTQALTSPDQLRQRVSFALSQIFVISMVEPTVGDQPRAAAAWLDMLDRHAFGRYRDLIEDVSRHPLMGTYLSHLKNQKADPRTGRVPDENYAREVMQLLSIGVVRLDEAGRSSGEPTYGPADISALARVFTGFSWACPDWPDNGCFSRGSVNNVADPDRWFKPMLGYPQYHSTEEKAFLGTVVPLQSPANPEASLRAAMDTLAAHPNVGPFIGRQLIQRLVTSNPSEAYVTAVSRAFANNGRGVRGDLGAVVRTVLLHPEARQLRDQAGKLREPVLRLSAVLRAFPYQSETGQWMVGNTDNPGSALGQTVLRSPSVFNFFRPGYVAPGTRMGAAGLVTPELQLLHETTAAGYVNYLRDVVSQGAGRNGPSGRRDVQPNFGAELALAGQAAALVDHVLPRLVPAGVTPALRSEIVQAVNSITVPALNASGSNRKAVDDALRARVNTAVLLTAASPEFLVQK